MQTCRPAFPWLHAPTRTRQTSACVGAVSAMGGQLLLLLRGWQQMDARKKYNHPQRHSRELTLQMRVRPGLLRMSGRQNNDQKSQENSISCISSRLL